MMRSLIAIVGILATPAVIYVALGPSEDVPKVAKGTLVIPNLSSRAQDGREHFAAACGTCHGAYGEGSDRGPILIHQLYAPSVFPDVSIESSVHNGAVARNWPFGDMPVIEGVGDSQLDLIIGFLREVQKANGID